EVVGIRQFGAILCRTRSRNGRHWYHRSGRGSLRGTALPAPFAPFLTLAEQAIQLGPQMLEMPFQRSREGVLPLSASQIQLHEPRERDLLNLERDDGHPAVDRLGNLVLDRFRVVGAGRKDEHHGAAAVDPIQDARRPVGADLDVPRRDPATESSGLQERTHPIGDILVLGGMADTNVGAHGTNLGGDGNEGRGSAEFTLPRPGTFYGPRRQRTGFVLLNSLLCLPTIPSSPSNGRLLDAFVLGHGKCF